MAEKVFSFEGFTLDLRRGSLCAGGGEVELRPKSFDVLQLLVENAGRLMSKEELIASVWPNVVVSDESLAHCVSELRSALADSDQRLIKTVPRRGYLFTARVSLMDSYASASPSGRDRPLEGTHGDRPLAVAPAHEAPGGLPPRLSIVVLPFANLGSDPAQDYFVDGLTESVTTDLSRIPGAFVIARNTAFTYKGKVVDVRQVGRELGVRYVMEGSVQSGPARVRVNAQLIDAVTGAHLWAERFDKSRADAFDMQDEITARLARIGGVELVVAEGRRAEREGSHNFDAVDLALHGWAVLNRHTSVGQIQEARSFFQKALQIDPSNVDGLVGLARTHAQEVAASYPDKEAEHIRAAESAITAALRFAPDRADAHETRALVLQALREPEEALRECEVAISLDHNCAPAHARAGAQKVFLGRAEEAEAHIAQAIRLSPRDPELRLWHLYIGMAYLYLGRLDEAIDRLRKSIQLRPNFELPYFFLAAALALSDRPDEAQEVCAAGRRVAPAFTISNFRNQPRGKHPTYLAQRERVMEGMRKAGVPR